MSERQRIYRDAFGVRRRLIWDDENPDQVTVHTAQDVEPVLDGVARDREIMSHNGVNKLLARIPIEVYERSVHERWDEGATGSATSTHRRPRKVPNMARRSVIDRKKFYDSIRASLFNGVLSQRQVDGMNYLLDVWEQRFPGRPIEWLAYALATVFHGKRRRIRWSPWKSMARGRVRRLRREVTGPHHQAYYGEGARATDVGRKLPEGRSQPCRASRAF